MSRHREGLVKGLIYYISEARTWAAGVRPIEFQSALRPNWGTHQQFIPHATILSTDYYYGLSRIDNYQVRKVRTLDYALTEDFLTALDTVDLVDMEVAQFYFLCYAYGKQELEWAALKGPANSLDNFGEQSDNSLGVFTKCGHKCTCIDEYKGP